MRSRAIALAVAMAAIAAPAAQAAKDKKMTWTLSTNADKTKLLVDITVRNTGKRKIYVVDKLVVSAHGNKFARSERLTVMNSDDPTVARFVLGAVTSDRPSTVVYEPTYERVAPGATVKRHFEVPLPLATWNPVGGTNPLSPQTRSARLEVFGFGGEPSRWRTLPSDDPEPLKVPEVDRAPLVFEAGPLPLP